MDQNLLQQFTSSEFQQYITELELAIESHSRWLGELNRALICHIPAVGELADNAHLRCVFGRWYAGLDVPELEQLAEFKTIGLVHEKVHQAARVLLLKEQAGESIGTEEYDCLIALSEELREHIGTLRNALKRNLNVVAKLLGKVFENAAEGVVITDPGARIITVNSSFTHVTGYEPHEVIGETPHILYSGRMENTFYREMWGKLLNTGQWHGEIWNRRKNGDIYLEWLSIAAVRDDAGNVTNYVGIFSDITSEKENKERLYQLAHFDILTELPNRMLFRDLLRQAMARARRNDKLVAVMFLDLDGFKAVNDTCGHNAGDELLKEVASRLKGSLRESDTVGRFGGDEFTIVLPDMDSVGAIAAVAEKVIGTVDREHWLGGRDVHITTSVGISLFPTQSEEAEQLIKQADAAMYHAKKEGKNRYCFFRRDMV